MIDLMILIQASACFLGRCGIRWIDKEYSISVSCLLTYNLEPIAANEFDSFFNVGDVKNALPKCLWIPARQDAFAILAMLQCTGARSKDAAVTDPILDNGLKGFFFQ